MLVLGNDDFFEKWGVSLKPDGNAFVRVLWLDQRHALKAIRASVGDEDGHRRLPRFFVRILT